MPDVPLRKLPRNHPCSLVFVDETGAIARDRFFGVGLCKMSEPSRTLRAMQKFRDRKHWYQEFKFSSITQNSVSLYKELIDTVLAVGELRFFCFIADRNVADPILRFGDPWTAYSKMVEQLVLASMLPKELTSVIADNYSTPDTVLFEEKLKADLNRRVRRLAVTTVIRADSKSSDGLQLVDLFTSAAAFEFRAHAGIATTGSPKSDVAEYLRNQLGAPTFIQGWQSDSHSIQIYEHDRWSAQPAGNSVVD